MAGYPWLADPSLAPPIRRDYTVTDLQERIGPAGVDGTVLVEAGLGELTETTRFLAIADATPEILGVVGWVDFTDPHLDATLAGLRDGPGRRWLVGVRDQVQGVADPGYLARPGCARAWRPGRAGWWSTWSSAATSTRMPTGPRHPVRRSCSTTSVSPASTPRVWRSGERW